ncbi:PREDICTED: proline dehydrogenase 2, mitochondrial-like [Nelumbo nucifera]|uniref:Proline dehydrogenase n=1 Tax=Nelumbo nucifera TaxID=4432 RepID=A0A1U7ZTZ2_NELNU|nr:PREDICTED: proline dehydrogenase 2, mitochondrial-like [Nelumbo nucifera]
MAMRSSPKLLCNLPYIVRSLNSSSSIVATVPPLGLSEKADGTVVKPVAVASPCSTLNLDDVEKLFKSVSTVQLLRSSLNLHMAAFGPVVELGMWVMRSRLVETAIIREFILTTVKHTFYEHFCAGENVEEASRTLQRLWNDGLTGILDYSLEDATDNDSCDRNLEEFLKTVDSTKFLPPSSVSFACVKISAICPISLLGRVSDLLRWKHKDPTFYLPWKRDTMPFLTNASPFYHTLKRPDPLTAEEEKDLQLTHQRLMKLCQKCLETNLPLLVDAEYTSVQPAIDYLTYCAAIDFNKDGFPIVFGTIQAYLKDSKQRMVQATEAAEKMGIPIGFKLVRGAYLSSETQIASSLGFCSPIHGSIKETHACYNDCTSFMLEKVARGSAAVVLATHNLESGKVATMKAQELGIGKGNEKLQFAQLKGMAEGLSYGLKSAGFQVSKYLPFGPVEKVMPYLLRRAEENKGLLSASTLDRQLMSKELKRRLKAAILGGKTTK